MKIKVTREINIKELLDTIVDELPDWDEFDDVRSSDIPYSTWVAILTNLADEAQRRAEQEVEKI